MKRNTPSISRILITLAIFLISFLYIQYGASLRPEFLVDSHYACGFGRPRCQYWNLRDLFLYVISIPIVFLLFWKKPKLTDKDDKNYLKVAGEKPRLLYKNIFYISCLILIYAGMMLYYTYLVFGK